MRAIKAGSVCLALVVAAWFGLGAWQTDNLNRAETIINAQTHTTAARARKAESLLDDAATLNPDRTVEIDRIHILLERNDVAAARGIAGELIRAEPQNLGTWIWVAHVGLAGNGSQRQLFELAARHISELDPQDTVARR